MYSPGHYKGIDPKKAEALIEQFPFSTLLTLGGKQISHLPLMLAHEELLGHMAKANPHWRELKQVEKCLAIFLGPNGYITPQWYVPKTNNVPTWNYTAVHVSGRFQIIEDKISAQNAMIKMVDFFENANKTNWSIPTFEESISGLMQQIVIFKMTDLCFETKFKLSQNRTPEDREKIIAKLKDNNPLLAKWMSEV